MKSILGVDCGDVIFYTFSGTLLPDVLDGLKEIVDSGRFSEVYIVSKANFLMKGVFLFRLWRLDFWGRTGIARDHIYFCRRPEDKAAICKKLAITDFVDDRLEVLYYLDQVSRRYALNPRRKKERMQFGEVLKKVKIVRSWKELVPQLVAD